MHGVCDSRAALEETLFELAREEQANAAAAALQRRHAWCVRQLEADSEQRYTWHATDAPLRPEAGEPVSLVLAIREPSGRIISGELSVPRDQFDGDAINAFLRELASAPIQTPTETKETHLERANAA
jgi:hypothetical protein